MRYANAPHILEAAIYARRPLLGFIFQLLGLLMMVLTIIAPRLCPEHGEMGIPIFMGITFFIWLIGWYLAVGSIWRSTLVCALLLQAVSLTWLAKNIEAAQIAASGAGL